jgi:alkylation response protein AidB-like acyl-CoA dehydrogenase
MGPLPMPDNDLDLVVDRLLEDVPYDEHVPDLFWAEQFDRGLAWVHFPVGDGGLGLTPGENTHVQQRLSRAGVRSPAAKNPLGHGMVAPTIVVHGNEAQRHRYLRGIFTCEEMWCQLFSEPGAGSDVASLATSARRDGDLWVLNGQKVWTTLGHVAQFGLILARTDPAQPKHRGITCFLLNMNQPGVEVRPLYQMTGEAEFNEIFLDEAVVEDDDRLGEVGQGWSVALTTLMNERVSIGGNVGGRQTGPMAQALQLWDERWRDPSAPGWAGLRTELIERWERNEVIRMTNRRAAVLRRAGTPGPEGSVAKITFAEETQRIYELCVKLLGPTGMLNPGGYDRVRPDHVGVEANDIAKAFLRSRANSIEGGTSEVLRNVLAERVLGLPAEPRGDKGTAWKDVPRN